MGPLDSTEALAASIRNAAWQVRHYRRALNRRERAHAIVILGATVRDAFNRTENFEPLLVAVVDGLRPTPEPAPF